MLGWIKLHRSIQENEFYFSERFTKTQAWIDLLLLANHKPATIFIRGVEVHLERGELAYSQKSLSRRWKWNERTVNKFLRALESRQMIQRRSSNVTTIISLKNYSIYQGFDAEGDREPEGSTPQTTAQSTEQSTHKIQTDKNDNNVNNGEYLPQKEEVVFENDFFSVTKNTIEEFKKAYPFIQKFHPELARITDVLKEKQGNGEVIKSPMAFLHTHLSKLNHELSQKAEQPGQTRQKPRGLVGIPTESKPMRIGELLNSSPLNEGTEKGLKAKQE
jgi:DNA replication protein DnaD